MQVLGREEKTKEEGKVKAVEDAPHTPHTSAYEHARHAPHTS